MKRKKPIIGVCGGIGSGKSFIAHEFERLGAVVLVSDDIAKSIYYRADVKAQLREWFGEDVFDKMGAISRVKMADKVFGDKKAKAKIEKLIHPLVAEARDQMVEYANSHDHLHAVVLDSPLLVEKGLHKQCDHVIFVDTPAKKRYERVKSSRGWTKQEWERRENQQIPLDKKRALAHSIIKNESSEDSVFLQVQEIFDKITRS